MTVQELLQAIRRGWVWILVCTIVGVACGFAAVVFLPRTYTATATDFVRVAPGSQQNAFEAAQFVAGRVNSYPVLVESPEVLAQVIHDNRLTMSQQKLAKMITAENPADSSLLLVTAKAGSAKLAANIANSAATHLATKVTASDGGDTAVIGVELVVPASIPTSPSFPQALLTFPIAVLVGLVVGLLIAISRFRAAPGRRRGHRTTSP